MKNRRDPAPVPVNAQKLTPESQRSVAATFTYYVDYPYRCVRCRADAVFTAAEQKTAFEDHGVSIQKRRVLCRECWKSSLALDAELASCETSWKFSKAACRSDPAFLSRWAHLLRENRKYGRRFDRGRVRMLEKLLAGA